MEFIRAVPFDEVTPYVFQSSVRNSRRGSAWPSTGMAAPRPGNPSCGRPAMCQGTRMKGAARGGPEVIQTRLATAV